MTAEAVAPRCAAHPTRLAVGDCPVCARARCAADAAEHGEHGCAVCHVAADDNSRPLSRSEVVVRAALAAYAVALPGGWIADQYVNVHLMSLGWPAVLGVGASAAAAAASGGAGDRRLVLVIAGIAAVVGTALGFRLFDTPVTPIHPWRQVWLPYVAALVGVVAWPLLFAAPRRPRSQDAQPVGTSTRSNR